MDRRTWLPQGARWMRWVVPTTWRALLAFAGLAACGLGLAPGPVLAATIDVPCGDVPGLVLAITNAAPGDTINLAAGCTYTLTTSDNPGSGSGSNGLPVIKKTLTIAGNGATITRSAATQFRFFEVSIGGSLTLDQLTLSNGSPNGPPGVTRGGAIFVKGQGPLTIRNSTLASNQAPDGGGAIFTDGTSTVTRTTFVGNGIGTSSGTSSGTAFGGAIWQAFGTLTVTNSSFSGNTAFSGSAIASPTTLNVSSSTFSGNVATSGAGGGALYNFSKGTLTLQNSIVANNTGGNCTTAPFGGGPVTDGGHNISWPDTTCPGLNADPMLGPLANNGGATQTFALQSGSPALDAVPPAGAGCPATDQRGVFRPQGPSCDIGAFELAVIPTPTPTPTQAPVPLPPSTGHRPASDARWFGVAGLAGTLGGLILLAVAFKGSGDQWNEK
jgi:autotransporter family porin